MAQDRRSHGGWGQAGGAGKGPGRRQSGASHLSGAFRGAALPGVSTLRPSTLPLQINGVASEDMSLADTQQLIERTEGTLTLLILRDHRQFLVNIPDIEDSQSDSSRMDGEGTW